MIVIRKADKYASCNSCLSRKNVKEICTREKFGVVIMLCEDCRKLLMEKIKDEFTEYGV